MALIPGLPEAGARLRDPRLFQLAFQAALLALGAFARDFSLHPGQMALAMGGAVAAQVLWLRHFKLPGVGLRSAVITGFGLSLLLRADSFWLHPLVGFLAISAKFWLRPGGKHLFNPANSGVMFALLCLPGAWVSPGQWGSDIAIAVWLVALGALVAAKARQGEAAWLFLGVFLGLVALRLVYLGYPVERAVQLFLHQAGNGALLLFAFFMISDPMTLPDRAAPRRFHVVAVAGLAFVWQFVFYRPLGPLWALFLLSPLVPLWDRLFPGPRYAWPGNTPLHQGLTP